MGGKVDVVVPNDGHLVAAKSQLRARAEGTDRQGVVPGEDRGGGEVGCQQFETEPIRIRLERSRLPHDGLEPSLGHRHGVHLPADGVRQELIGNARDGADREVRDPSMAQLEEVIHHHRGPATIVVGHRVVVDRRIMTSQQHDRNLLGETLQPVGCNLGRDRDQAVHPPVGQRVEERRRFHADHPRRDDELIARVGKLVGRPLHHLREEVVAQLGDLEADREARAPHRPCRNVRAVAQLVDRRLDPVAHRGAHPVGIANDLRHGRLGDARRGGDVIHRRPLPAVRADRLHGCAPSSACDLGRKRRYPLRTTRTQRKWQGTLST